MNIQLEKIKQPEIFSVDFAGQELELQGKPMTVDPIHLDLSIEPSGSGYQISGIFPFHYSSLCDRCLEPTQFSGQGEIRQKWLSTSNSPGESDYSLSENEMDEFFTDEMIVKPAHLVSQAILLESPSKLLCSTDCKGLCPQCGINKNQESCNCELHPSDPRWSALKSFTFQTLVAKEDS